MNNLVGCGTSDSAYSCTKRACLAPFADLVVNTTLQSTAYWNKTCCGPQALRHGSAGAPIELSMNIIYNVIIIDNTWQIVRLRPRWKDKRWSSFAGRIGYDELPGTASGSDVSADLLMCSEVVPHRPSSPHESTVP
jgi:hypothetical protein